VPATGPVRDDRACSVDTVRDERTDGGEGETDGMSRSSGGRSGGGPIGRSP
jgi:hypothetical protein